MTYAQKGFDGVNIISKLSAGKSLDEISDIYKHLIGAIPGLAGGMFYGNAGLSLRTTMTEAVSKLYNKPELIPQALTLFVTNGLASNSMTNIGQNVIKNKHNMFHLTEGPKGLAYVAMITVGGSCVNMNTTFTKTFLTEKDPLASDLTIGTLRKRLEDPDHLISSDAMQQIRQFGLFSDSEAERSHDLFEYNDENSNLLDDSESSRDDQLLYLRIE